VLTGKVIDRTFNSGVKIDIEDDGLIKIASADGESAQKAIDIINQIVEEPEPGKIYEGKVTKIADFGAFVEIIPGTEGLCHISELEHFRVRYVDDVVKAGDIIKVKCLEVEPSGKIRLSRKALIEKPEGAPQEQDAGHREERSRDDRPRGPRSEGRGPRGGDRGGDRGGRSMGGRDRGDRPGNRMPRRDDRFRDRDRDGDRDRDRFRDDRDAMPSDRDDDDRFNRRDDD
jgi:polyribonucleotide nucleotidyltransferase